ncbi:MAG: DNA adenine methylase [Myxococcota bacterium]
MSRPFLKWAGGKRQLLDALVARFDRAGATGRYHEPFVGGGALFFELRRTGRVRDAVLSDTNPNLVEVYVAVRDDVDALVARLREHAARHDEAYYYAVRGRVPEGAVDRAARVIYLNKTCFNGLYRENSRGEFNVPYGRYDNPTICDEPNLRACSAALAGVSIEARPFERVLDHAVAGDFVYFDPPYVPVSATSSFTGYAKGGFGPADQERLAEVFASLADRGVSLLLSNSMTATVRDLFSRFHIEEVPATRAINSRGDRRGAIAEALVTAFPPRRPITEPTSARSPADR